MESSFTERQLKILLLSLESAKERVTETYRWSDVNMLKADLRDLLQFEQEAKRERKKSLAIERRASKA